MRLFLQREDWSKGLCRRAWHSTIAVREPYQETSLSCVKGPKRCRYSDEEVKALTISGGDEVTIELVELVEPEIVGSGTSVYRVN